MRSQASVEIDRPIEDVFRLTNGSVAEWSTIVVENEVIEDKNDGGIGTQFRIVTNDRGQRMVFHCEVTEHVPPKLSGIRMIGPQFDIAVRYEFDDLGGRTRVTQMSDVAGKGIAKLMMLMFGWLGKRASCESQANELRSLKEFVEANC